MSNWYQSTVGTWFSQAIVYDLSRDWRKTPAIYLGDSGSVNKTKAAPSAVRLVRSQLRDHCTDCRVTCGTTVKEYQQALAIVVGNFGKDRFAHCDVDMLPRVMESTPTQAASSLKLVESLNSIPGTTAQGRPGAWVSREQVCIIVDCCNSAVCNLSLIHI